MPFGISPGVVRISAVVRVGPGRVRVGPRFVLGSGFPTLAAAADCTMGANWRQGQTNTRNGESHIPLLRPSAAFLILVFN